MTSSQKQLHDLVRTLEVEKLHLRRATILPTGLKELAELKSSVKALEKQVKQAAAKTAACESREFVFVPPESQAKIIGLEEKLQQATAAESEVRAAASKLALKNKELQGELKQTKTKLEKTKTKKEITATANLTKANQELLVLRTEKDRLTDAAKLQKSIVATAIKDEKTALRSLEEQKAKNTNLKKENAQIKKENAQIKDEYDSDRVHTLTQLVDQLRAEVPDEAKMRKELERRKTQMQDEVLAGFQAMFKDHIDTLEAEYDKYLTNYKGVRYAKDVVELVRSNELPSLDNDNVDLFQYVFNLQSMAYGYKGFRAAEKVFPRTARGKSRAAIDAWDDMLVARLNAFNQVK